MFVFQAVPKVKVLLNGQMMNHHKLIVCFLGQTKLQLNSKYSIISQRCVLCILRVSDGHVINISY